MREHNKRRSKRRCHAGEYPRMHKNTSRKSQCSNRVGCLLASHDNHNWLQWSRHQWPVIWTSHYGEKPFVLFLQRLVLVGKPNERMVMCSKQIWHRKRRAWVDSDGERFLKLEYCLDLVDGDGIIVLDWWIGRASVGGDAMYSSFK